jgi:hypothetical protein
LAAPFNGIPDSQQASATFHYLRAYIKFILIPCAGDVAHAELDNRQRKTIRLHAPVIDIMNATVLASGRFEPDRVIGVVNNPHLVGLEVSNAQGQHDRVLRSGPVILHFAL